MHNSGSGNNGLGDYDIVGVLFKSIGMSSGIVYGGLAGGANLWMQGNISDGVFTHEFGHNYGIGHSGFWQTSDGSVVGTGANVEYGDTYDIMGSGDLPEGHFHSQAKQRLDWLAAGEWADATASGSNTYRLYRIDSQFTTGTPRGVRITKVPTVGSQEYYWLSYRPLYGANPRFGSGAYMVWQRAGQSRSWLVDTVPATSGDKTDAPIELGRTYSDTTANIHITPTASGGTGDNSYIDVRINLGAFAGNGAPTSGAISGPATLVARTEATFTVSASDPNSDPLAYSWTAGDGAVSPSAASITRSWTVGGSYTLNCTISDMKGGTVTVSKSITVTDPIDTWTKGGLTTGEDLYEIVPGKGRFVAAAYWGQMFFSWDGITWTDSGQAVNIDTPKLAFGNNVFVAAGEHGNLDQKARIAYSHDGRRWMEATYPAGLPYLRGVTYGNGKFVAVGDDGVVLTSVDGITWSLSTIPAAPDLREVVWEGSVFVASAIHPTTTYPGVFWTSTNGTHWTQGVSRTDIIIYNLFAINGTVFFTGWYDNINYSTDDGATWSLAGTPGSTRWSTWDMAAADDGTLLCIGQAMDEPGQPRALLVSQNSGVTWSRSTGTGTAAIALECNGLTYSQGRFFAVEDNGGVQRTDSFYPGNAVPVPEFSSAPATGSARTSIAFSATATDPDGGALIYAWDFGSNIDIADGASIAPSFDFGGSYPMTLHVSDGRGGHATLNHSITVSDPSRTWTQRTSGTTATLYTVTGNESIAVAAGGTGGIIRTSPDGVTWTSRTISTPGNVSFSGSVWTGSQFILVGKDYNFGVSAWVGMIATSSNGTTWTRAFTSTTAGTDLNAVTSSGTVHVAVGGNGNILRSTNSTTWTPVSVPALATSTLDGIAYGGGTFVLTGYASNSSGSVKVFTSTDGLAWIDRSAGAGVDSWQDLRAINYLNDRFVSSGWYSKLRISTDGAQTFNTNRNNTEDLPAQAYGNGIWFTAGINRSDSNAAIDVMSLDGTNWLAYAAPTTTNRQAATFFANTFITVGDSGSIWQTASLTPPTISQHPAHAEVAEGSNVSFTVVASGGTLSYQWQKGTTDIDDATNATYTINSATTGQAGSYRCIVTNSAGDTPSNPATLTVISPPEITSDPTGLAVDWGDPVSFSVTATGQSLNYQWQRNNSNINGATASTYSIDAVVAGQAGNYRCIVSNSAGSDTSASAMLSINGAPFILRQPYSLQAEAGATATLDIEATGNDLNFAWQRGAVTVGNTAIWTQSNFQSAHAGTYICTVSNPVDNVPSDQVTVALIAGLGTAMDDTIRKWSTTGDLPWQIVKGSAARDAVDAMKAGAIGHSQRSLLRTTVTGPFTLRWWQRISAAAGDVLTVSVDGVQVSSITGEVAWQQASTVIPDGLHTVEFAYVKDSTTTGGSDTAWVDGVAVGPPFSISTQPVPRIVNAGGSTSFSVATTGLSTTYQWRRNGKNILGATAATLNLSNVTTAAHAGDYSCLIGGVTASTAAKLIVVTPGLVQRPKQTGTAMFKVTPSSSTGLIYAWYAPGDILMSNGPRIAGATTSTLTLKNCDFPDEGGYTCRITGFSGTQILDVTPIELDVVTLPVIETSGLAAPTAGVVSQFYTWTANASQFPTSYTITGLPSGLTASKAGVISGIPNVGGNFALTIKATNAAGTTTVPNVPLVIQSLPTGATGTFSAIVGRSNIAALGGTLTLTIAPAGTYTGTLKLHTLSYKLKGRMVGVLNSPPSFTLSIPRTTGGALTLALVFSPGTEDFIGTITDIAANEAAVTGGKHVWTKLRTAANFVGRYNATHALPAPQLLLESNPHGIGYTQLNVTGTGTVTITGKLGDGIPITGSATLWPDGRLPTHFLLYANKGSFTGLHQVVLGTGPTYLNNTITGVLSWNKTGPSGTTDRTYAAGFDAPVLNTTGNKWLTAAPVLGLSTARTTFADGEIDAAAQFAALNQVFTISTANKAIFPDATTNPTRLALTLNSATGLFTGTATLTDPHPVTGAPTKRTLSISGVLNSTTQTGSGIAVLPSRPTLPVKTQTGSISIAAP